MTSIKNILSLKEPNIKHETNKYKTSQRTVKKSYEWIAFGDDEPHCWAPWRVLKVDIFGQTLSCCGFFEKLPEFEWPTAKEFHSEEGMWNHPVMQHLRGSLRTEDELPFCTFCKNNDKRHPDSLEKKNLAASQSSDILQRIYDESAEFEFKGSLTEVQGTLTDYQIHLPDRNNVVLKPFKRSLLQYRRFLRIRGFRNIGSVLQLGVGAGAYSPFLAEVNDSLTITDFKIGRIKNVSGILRKLNFDNFNEFNITNIDDLKNIDQQFDGIWIDGEWFSQYGRSNTLNAINLILKPGAIIYVAGAKSLGHLVKKAIQTKSNNELEAVLSIIEKGPIYGGQNSYLNADSLIKTLSPFGLSLDRSRPALSRYIGTSRSRNLSQWNDTSELTRLLRNEKYRSKVNSNPNQLDGLVECVSFTMQKKS